MILVLKRGAGKKTIARIERKLPKGKAGFNAKKYNGKLKLKETQISLNITSRLPTY